MQMYRSDYVISNFKTINGVGYSLAFNFCQDLHLLPASCSTNQTRAALVSPDGSSCYVMSTQDSIDYQMNCKLLAKATTTQSRTAITNCSRTTTGTSR